MMYPSFRSVASVLLVSALALACSAAPISGGASPTPHPTTPEGPLPTLPPATQPPATDAPPAAKPTPHSTTPDGSLLTPPPATQPASTDAPDGPASEASVRGTWIGTIESNGGSQGIRFLLRDIGGVISGTALWDSGKIDNGLRGGFEDGVLTLDDVLVGGINFYEGTIEGDVFSGTHTTVPNLQGQAPSRFETTREE